MKNKVYFDVIIPYSETLTAHFGFVDKKTNKNHFYTNRRNVFEFFSHKSLKMGKISRVFANPRIDLAVKERNERIRYHIEERSCFKVVVRQVIDLLSIVTAKLTLCEL